MIYHQDKRLLLWRCTANRFVSYLFDFAFAALYWWARKRGEYAPPFKRSSLRWVFGKQPTPRTK